MKYISSFERVEIERRRNEGERELVLSLLNKNASVAQIAETLDMSIRIPRTPYLAGSPMARETRSPPTSRSEPRTCTTFS